MCGTAMNLMRIFIYKKATVTQQKITVAYGGLEEIRTPDPHNANVVRSQLRYKPISFTGILYPFQVPKSRVWGCAIMKFCRAGGN